MTANVLVLCAAGMLVTAYLMVGQKALFTTIRLYGVQSMLLAIVAATNALSEGRHELFVTTNERAEARIERIVICSVVSSEIQIDVRVSRFRL